MATQSPFDLKDFAQSFMVRYLNKDNNVIVLTLQLPGTITIAL